MPWDFYLRIIGGLLGDGFKMSKERIREFASDAFRRNEPMRNKELSFLQRRLANWQRENFGMVLPEHLALGATEEVGELCHIMLKHIQSIRGFDNQKKFQVELGDALADATIYLMQLATYNGLDFGELLHWTAEEVMERDWKKNPESGE